uniref:Uncharacterized protein n=1 Tax=Timema tahoe TaxID=61484 RepID=A0A7R9IHU4_9NEOP|nr:unnamed protein product [Timema tahoe]
MESRFEDLTKLQIPDWILDPFSFEAVDKLDNSLQTEFLDLKYDCEAKIIFKQSGYEIQTPTSCPRQTRPDEIDALIHVTTIMGDHQISILSNLVLTDHDADAFKSPEDPLDRAKSFGDTVVHHLLGGLVRFVKQHSQLCYSLGLSTYTPTNNPDNSKKKEDRSLYAPEMFVFVVHAVFLTVFCLLCVHVQVTTRLVASASPVLYWFAAYLFPGTGEVSSSSSIASRLEQIGGSKFTAQYQHDKQIETVSNLNSCWRITLSGSNGSCRWSTITSPGSLTTVEREIGEGVVCHHFLSSKEEPQDNSCFTLLSLLLYASKSGVSVCNYGQHWEVGVVKATTPYRAGTGHEINASISVMLGLRSVNITLVRKGESIPNTPLVNETINYNERFWWTWDQGRFGFGPYAGTLQQSFRQAQRRGLPLPILWVADYFTWDGEGLRFGRTGHWHSKECSVFCALSVTRHKPKAFASRTNNKHRTVEVSLNLSHHELAGKWMTRLSVSNSESVTCHCVVNINTHFVSWYRCKRKTTAFPCWLLANFFFVFVVRYGAYFTILTGVLQLLACLLWTVIRNPYQLEIPFEEKVLSLHYGINYWLTLSLGILSTTLGLLVAFLDLRYPDEIALFFGIDPLADYEEYHLNETHIGVHLVQGVTFVIDYIAKDGKVKVILKRRTTVRLGQRSLFRSPAMVVTTPEENNESPLYLNVPQSRNPLHVETQDDRTYLNF